MDHFNNFTDDMIGTIGQKVNLTSSPMEIDKSVIKISEKPQAHGEPMDVEMEPVREIKKVKSYFLCLSLA